MNVEGQYYNIHVGIIPSSLSVYAHLIHMYVVCIHVYTCAKRMKIPCTLYIMQGRIVECMCIP